MYEKAGEGDTLKTVFFVINNDFFLETFDEVRNEEQYNNSIEKHQSPSNSLENYVHSCLKNKLNSLIVVNKNERDLFPNSDINLFSCVEYFSVIPVKNENKFVVWKNTHNVVDNKTVLMSVFENNKAIARIGYVQSETSSVYGVFDFNPDKKYLVVQEDYNAYGDKIKKSEIKFGVKSDIETAGLFDVLNTNVAPNIKSRKKYNLHHFEIDDRSLNSISELTILGFVYRGYYNSTDVSVLKSLLYQPSDHHLILKNVELTVDGDRFNKILKESIEYMYDNGLLLISFTPSFENQTSTSMYTSLSMSNADGYVVNNNYLKSIKQSIDRNNVKQSLSLFNTHLSHVMKGFTSDSIIKRL